MKKLVVDSNNDGKKVIAYLTYMFPNLNINNIYKSLRKRDIKLNGKRINSNVVLHFNDVLEIYISDDNLTGTKKTIDIPIIYEDENIVVFNKPDNLEVVGDNSLTSIMKDKYDFLEPCHRIDRNTTGLVLYAKNKKSLEILLDKFKKMEIEKHYIACCYGMGKNSCFLTSYLFKDRKKSLVYISDEPKKYYSKIETSYKLINYNKQANLSLLDVTLHTGKTHQIRAHLAHSSLPILGDGKYGSYEINKKYKCSHQLLCSYSIKFNLKTDADILNYLNDLQISLKSLPFTEYFE